MPRFDKTGPGGLGPKTGRGLGNCEPEEQVKKAKKEGVATTEEIVKNILE